MDTTKENIEKCKEADEIQLYRTLWKRCEAGDFAYNADEDKVEVQEEGVMLLVEDVWLPRQDQLQEMMSKQQRLDNLLIDFYEYHCRKQKWWGMADAVFPSMEQLWLAFVMKEKFNKEWKDGTWKKVS